MTKLFDKHIELVQAVNDTSVQSEKITAEATLRGFRTCLQIAYPQEYGSMLMDCDYFYIEQGVDEERLMCCGVFLYSWNGEEIVMLRSDSK